MVRRLALGALCLLLPRADVQAQTAAAWRHQAFREITDFAVSATGAVMVLTDSSVVALDPADGRALWERRGKLRYAGLGLSMVGLLGATTRPDVVDLQTGTTRWSLGELPLREPYAYLPLDPLNLLLVTGASDAGPLTLVAASLDSGTVRWRQDTLLSHVPKLPDRARDLTLADGQPPLFDTDSTAVLFPSRGGPLRIHLGTGALLWRADTLVDEVPPQAGRGYASMVADGDLVLVPYERRLMAVDRESGRVRWDRRERFPSRLAQIVPTPHGILVRGFFEDAKPSDRIQGFVELLDRATGRSRWPRPIKDLRDPTALTLRGDTAYLAGRDRFYTLDLVAARLREAGTLDFKGGESPWAVEERGGLLVLYSSQNVAGVEWGGSTRFHRYYPAPGASLLTKIVSTVVIVGLNTALGAHAQSRANATGGMVFYPQIAANPVLDVRYKGTVAAERFLHVLTSAEDPDGRGGFSVVRVEKETGEERGRVWVDGRSPDYRLDPASGTVYLLRKKRVIEALRFTPAGTLPPPP